MHMGFHLVPRLTTLNDLVSLFKVRSHKLFHTIVTNGASDCKTLCSFVGNCNHQTCYICFNEFLLHLLHFQSSCPFCCDNSYNDPDLTAVMQRPCGWGTMLATASTHKWHNDILSGTLDHTPHSSVSIHFLCVCVCVMPKSLLMSAKLYINILRDTVLASPIKVKSCNHCHLIWWTNWHTRISVLSATAKDCGMTLTTNHNKSAGRGWSVSQSWHQATPVGYISCQLLVAGLTASAGWSHWCQ